MAQAKINVPDSQGIIVQFNGETHPVLNYIKMCCRDSEKVCDDITDFEKRAKGRCWFTIIINDGSDIKMKPTFHRPDVIDDLFTI